MIKTILFLCISYLIVCGPTALADSALGHWKDIGYSVSGLAKMNPPRGGAAYSFLGVIDSKGSSDPRTVLINLDSQFNIINLNNDKVPVIPWANGFPSKVKDLESVAAIPNGHTGDQQQFVAAISDGHFWRFTVNNSNQVVNVVEGDDRLKQAGSTSSAQEIESLAFFINSSSGNIKLVWSGRGSRDHSAYLFAADLENSSSHIGYNDENDFQIQETHFNWPRPVWSDDGDTRLISDVKIATNPNGAIYVSSAFDGGNDGPFGATLYNIGTFTSASELDQNPSPYPPRTALFIGNKGKKVEAIEMLTGNPDDGFILVPMTKTLVALLWWLGRSE
jgi:hypothetical protein